MAPLTRPLPTLPLFLALLAVVASLAVAAPRAHAGTGDIRMTATGLPTDSKVGRAHTALATVRNHGSTTAPNVTIEVAATNGLEANSAPTCPGGFAAAPIRFNNVAPGWSCSIGSLAANASATMTVPAQAAHAGRGRLSAQAKAPGFDSLPQANVAEVDIARGKGTVAVSKPYLGLGRLQVGDVVTLESGSSLVLGSDPYTSPFSTTFVLPEGQVEVVSATIDGGSCTSSAGGYFEPGTRYVTCARNGLTTAQSFATVKVRLTAKGPLRVRGGVSYERASYESPESPSMTWDLTGHVLEGGDDARPLAAINSKARFGQCSDKSYVRKLKGKTKAKKCPKATSKQLKTQSTVLLRLKCAGKTGCRGAAWTLAYGKHKSSPQWLSGQAGPATYSQAFQLKGAVLRSLRSALAHPALAAKHRKALQRGSKSKAAKKTKTYKSAAKALKKAKAKGVTIKLTTPGEKPVKVRVTL